MNIRTTNAAAAARTTKMTAQTISAISHLGIFFFTAVTRREDKRSRKEDKVMEGKGEEREERRGMKGKERKESQSKGKRKGSKKGKRGGEGKGEERNNRKKAGKGKEGKKKGSKGKGEEALRAFRTSLESTLWLFNAPELIFVFNAYTEALSAL